MTENNKIVVLRPLDRFDEHISARLLLLHYNEYSNWDHSFPRARRPTGFTGLHGAAFFRIAEIFSTILEMKEPDGAVGNTDQADTEYGLTPLSWASWNGHEGVVKMLF